MRTVILDCKVCQGKKIKSSNGKGISHLDTSPSSAILFSINIPPEPSGQGARPVSERDRPQFLIKQGDNFLHIPYMVLTSDATAGVTLSA